MHVQSCCFGYKTYCFFDVLVAVAVALLKPPFVVVAHDAQVLNISFVFWTAELTVFVLFILELVNSDDPTLNFITNNPLDALLAVEIEPQKEFLLCFNCKSCLLSCLRL